MNLEATIGGSSVAPLLDGSTITLRRPVSSASIVIDDPDTTASISALDSVTIQIPAVAGGSGGSLPGSMLPGSILPGAGGGGGSSAVTIFTGFVGAVDIEPAGRPGQRRLKLQCFDWNWRLDNPPGFVIKSYSDASDQDIILDALADIGLDSDITASVSTVAEIQTGITIAFDGATMREVLDEMTKASGGVWWVDGTTLYYNTEAAATAAGWNVNTDSPDNSSTYDVEALSRSSRHDFPLNSVTVIGPKDEYGVRATATSSDATSISAIGTYAKKIEVKTATVDAYAQIVADQLVAAGKDPRSTIRFRFSDADGRSHLMPNQKITATSTRFGLSADAFVTREVRIKQRKESVSEFDVEAGDFRPSVTDILRKLEQSARSSTLTARQVRGLSFVAASAENVESAASVPNLEDMAEFTIMLTFKFDTLPGAVRTLATKQSANEGWRVYMNASSVLHFERTKTSTNFSIQGPTIEAGKIYRAVISYTGGTTTSDLYLNGVDAKASANAGSGTLHTDVGHKFIAAAGDGFATQYVIWDIALPSPTAASVHVADLNALPFASNVQLRWMMDEFFDGESASGTNTILDRSGNDYHGTPINTPTGAVALVID